MGPVLCCDTLLAGRRVFACRSRILLRESLEPRTRFAHEHHTRLDACIGLEERQAGRFLKSGAP
jgi:hypothetical protein